MQHARVKIEFSKSRWEYGQVPFDDYAARVAADGFDGAEVFLAAVTEPDSALKESLERRGLFLIVQAITRGDDCSAHGRSLEAQLARAAACGARFVNCHTGSDFFSFNDNCALFRLAEELGARHKLKVLHETHRGRALYNLPDTLRYLEALPGLRLTADISHFMCVHESELRDHGPMLEAVAARTDHIHARVGFAEGPQVGHPLVPEWSDLLAHYLAFWKSILERRAAAGEPVSTVTPEAGPPGYMPVLPYTNLPVADAWTVNREMKDWLKARLPVF